jgi:putative toxin-antitoxin system antitoxin component (TIGR02293 family)
MSMSMTSPALSAVGSHRGPHARPISFWGHARTGRMSAGATRSAFSGLVSQVHRSPSIVLYEAVEEGVPTHLVDLIATAMRLRLSSVIEMLGISPTTLRRKTVADEPLPDLVGHRIMGFLRIAATLRSLLNEGGEPVDELVFDFEGWLAKWILQAHPEFGGRTPAKMLRNPESLRAIEQVLERMRGGLPA